MRGVLDPVKGLRTCHACAMSTACVLSCSYHGHPVKLISRASVAGEDHFAAGEGRAAACEPCAQRSHGR